MTTSIYCYHPDLYNIVTAPVAEGRRGGGGGGGGGLYIASCIRRKYKYELLFFLSLLKLSTNKIKICNEDGKIMCFRLTFKLFTFQSKQKHNYLSLILINFFPFFFFP